MWRARGPSMGPSLLHLPVWALARLELPAESQVEAKSTTLGSAEANHGL